MRGATDMLEFRNVTKVYTRAAGGRVLALAEVSFTVRPGEMLVLSGAAGAGKSTVLRLACGEDQATTGTIWVDGEEVGRLGRRGLARLRRQLGIVPQTPPLVADRTVFGNVALVLHALGVPRREGRARALAALRDVGLGTQPNALAAQLAAGERGRLALARALAVRPRLLLADEPAPLEPPPAGWLTALRALNDQGTTIVLATRDARLAGELRARSVILENGRVRVGEPPLAAGARPQPAMVVTAAADQTR